MLAIVIVAALVAALLIYVANRPTDFAIRREATIAAPADKVYPLIADFHAWANWSPYEKRDPAMAKTYSGPASGLGSVYEWDGNNQVGSGRMEVTEAAAPSRLVLDLRFFKPMKGHNQAVFTLEPVDGQTRVIWAMTGKYGFPAKLMGIFLNMDKMIGTDFAAGLADLKTVAEA
jgi:uncharacterized protein YndB with AHSA1/START domain